MSDPNAQPAPTLEEAEAALANMDPKLARILRARLGLAPAEPKPPAPIREPETSARAVIREQLADLDPNASAFDPEAMRRLDAEIEAKAKGKAEQEAAEAAKRAEVARRESEAVTAALEPMKARAPRLSPVKRRMIESSVEIRGEAPNEITYQHSVFCQTVLPYRDPGPDVRVWERQQGQVSLRLEAGYVKDPKGNYVPVGLPFGPAARLILCHVNNEALRTGSSVIDAGDSLTAFVRRLQGFDPNGKEVSKIKKQLIRITAALIRLAADHEGHTRQVDTKIIHAFDVWDESFEGERFLFPQEIYLSEDYFKSLRKHAVPLDERAIAALAHSAMGLDVYTWLAQRAHRIDPQRPQFIPWTALYAQFGQGYDRIRDFRRAFLGVLKAVQTQYPEVRFKTDKGGMLLGHSSPPVPQRHIIVLPPAKTDKG